MKQIISKDRSVTNSIEMKRLLLSAITLFLILPLFAQNVNHKATVRPKNQGGATVHHDPVGLTVSSRLNTAFWVYIDEVLQNERPVKSISITDIPEGDSFVRVVLDDDESHCFGQDLEFSRNALSFVIDRQGNYYGWEPASHSIRPELTMPLVLEDIPMIPSMPMAPPMMSERDFEEARTALANESFDNTRLTLAKQIVAANPMCAAQVTEICKLFSFESNKLAFAKYAYPYCVDKNKYYLVNTAFSYDSSKRELDSFLQEQ